MQIKHDLRHRVPDPQEVRLPGKPGKFYSLYAELCRPKHEDLRNGLEQALLRMEQQPGFEKALRADMERKCEEFKAILEDKTFNKMITGMLYYQEMCFYKGLLKQKVIDIIKALKEGFFKV